jgi:hypothetical protein
MSEAKTPKKEGKKSSKTEKTEPKATSDSAEKPSSDSAEKPSSETKTANKSASQSSISHFSSVATKEYRSGWESIFGNKKAGNKASSKQSNTVDLPLSLAIQDEDIKEDLRALLYKAFQRQARKEGISLAKLKKIGDIEYRLDCDISDK